VETAVLVPIKGFSAAKQRLEGALSAGQRQQLARWTAERVLGASGEHPTYVVCDDDVVAAWARDHGAHVLWEVDRGLNAAVDHAVHCLAVEGHRHVVVVHGDLPHPAPLGAFAAPGVITLVPDRHDDGTNLMSFPIATPLLAAYGQGSFRRHLMQAMSLGVGVQVVRDSLMALDLDHPSDLDHPLVKELLPAWLRTNPVNPPPTS
jgi:2-phospho-L-lactate/phosphoenolpyruvate guanylyltransferase